MGAFWRRFRRDEDGGPILVLAFSVIAVTVMMGLGAISMANGAVTHQQRVTQTAEASTRSAVDSILAALNNTSAQSARKTVAELTDAGRWSFGEDPITTTVTAAEISGNTINLTLKIESTGRVPWTREGHTTLKLANAVSLSRIDEGRYVWDFASPSGANSKPSEVVALWSPGELSVYVPGIDEDAPASSPNPLTLVSDYVGDTREYAFGIRDTGDLCTSGTPEVQTRSLYTKSGKAPGSFSAWAPADITGGAVVLPGTLGGGLKGPFNAGDEVTVEARLRCTTSAGASSWSVSRASMVAGAAAEAPTATITRAGESFQVDMNAHVENASTVRQRVRYSFDGGDSWSDWKIFEGTEVSLSIPAEKDSIMVENQVRYISAGKSDTGWSGSGKASND